jgi:hypothetical protein
MLRSFYQRQIFLQGTVPDSLVDYARATTLVYGAHHAPRHFAQGRLTNGQTAFPGYTQLRVPTLVIVPKSGERLIQQFDHADDLRSTNPEFILLERIDAGLMPHWETPMEFFRTLDDFLLAA